MRKHKTGYVAILGLPNVGKSTLLNALLNQKLSITTEKPQTTRKRILGILSENNYQVIFLDTPGILNPRYLLQEKMMDDVILSSNDADIFILMIDVKDDSAGRRALKNEFVTNKILSSRNKKFLVLNKIDLISQDETSELIDDFESKKIFDEVIPVSSTRNFNIEKLLDIIVENLPEGPKLYPDNIVADQNERFFVAELIREKLFEQYKDEIPYSSEILIAGFKERDGAKDFISAEIVVEKENQKAIVIGKDGKAIKLLGKSARESIESFLDKEVFLELRVKVRKKWRSDNTLLKSFGYLKSD